MIFVIIIVLSYHRKGNISKDYRRIIDIEHKLYGMNIFLQFSGLGDFGAVLNTLEIPSSFSSRFFLSTVYAEIKSKTGIGIKRRSNKGEKHLV